MYFHAVGRLAGRSIAVTNRPSPSNTTIGWKPYLSQWALNKRSCWPPCTEGHRRSQARSAWKLGRGTRNKDRPGLFPCAKARADRANFQGVKGLAERPDRSGRQNVLRQLERRIGPHGRSVVAVLVAGSDHEHPEPDHVGKAVDHLGLRADRRCTPPAVRPRPGAVQSPVASTRPRPMTSIRSKRATTNLPPTGDRPGGGGIRSSMADGLPSKSHGITSAIKSYGLQRLKLHSPPTVNFPGEERLQNV